VTTAARPQALEHVKPPFMVEYHHSKKNNFSQTMADDVWLEICGKNQWIAFGHDQKFHTITVEAMAIKQHRVAAFYFPGANAGTWSKLCYFVRAFPRILEIVKANQAPYLYRIHPTTRIEKVNLP
jgi:hypothetical protein